MKIILKQDINYKGDHKQNGDTIIVDAVDGQRLVSLGKAVQYVGPKTNRKQTSIEIQNKGELNERSSS